MSQHPILKASPSDDYNISVITDGTHTVVEITSRDEYGIPSLVARGESHRRPGERRKEDIGQLIAFRRAFANAATYVDERLKELGASGWAAEPVNIEHLLRKAKAKAEKGES